MQDETEERLEKSSGYCSKSTTKDLAVTIIYNFRGIFIVLTIHSSDFKVRLLKVVRFKLINQKKVVAWLQITVRNMMK